MVVFSLVAVVVGGLAFANLTDAQNRATEQLDPAASQALRLQAALLDQETGVRGYALSAQQDFLAPYTQGLATQQNAVRLLQKLVGTNPTLTADLDAVLHQVDIWRTTYAQPTIAQVQRNQSPLVSPEVDQGKADFDNIRQVLTALLTDVSHARQQATNGLRHATTLLVVVAIAIAIVLVLIVAVLAIVLWGGVLRPVNELTAQVRRVADGEFEHPVAHSGPREVRELGVDVNRMRARILHELSALQTAHSELDASTRDLQRSNAELEQFAYVASHDLQEPLRKVASFCQLLQRRYGGELDERADQYIGFAVDGAKRMQVLINDLLAFSRVGRLVRERQPESCTDLLAQAERNLGESIESTGAIVEHGELPTVLAEAPLLTTVFQNLLSNAIKFHGEQAPHVTIDAVRQGEEWRFDVTDDGIGIKPDYAERIFVIFQRLHGKEAYPGTGIGLAMCRKIVEYHGGRIWLDTSVQNGSRFCFTLPALAQDPVGATPVPTVSSNAIEDSDA